MQDILRLRFISVIPKLNIIFSSEVLVSSDKKPYSNLTFQNVSVRQGSSDCNRTLRDMKIATRGGCRVGQNMSYHLSFC